MRFRSSPEKHINTKVAAAFLLLLILALISFGVNYLGVVRFMYASGDRDPLGKKLRVLNQLGFTLEMNQMREVLLQRLILLGISALIVVLAFIVWIEAAGENQTLIFKVGDTGRGIPEADQPQIFEEFSQFNVPMGENKGGTGLGLAIPGRCKSLYRIIVNFHCEKK